MKHGPTCYQITLLVRQVCRHQHVQVGSCKLPSIQLEIVAITKTQISSFLPRSGLLISRRKKVKFRGIFSDKFAEKSADFRIIFLANIVEKQSVKNGRFCGYFKANFARNQKFNLCTDQTSVFNVFLTKVIICSFNNNILQK